MPLTSVPQVLTVSTGH